MYKDGKMQEHKMKTSPKVMVFGSCMSNLTANYLVADYGFEQTHSVHHNRSDAFIKYHIDKSETMIPLDEIEKHLVYKDESEHEARQFLRNQYSDYIGFHDMQSKIKAGRTFFDDLQEEEFDIILLDNFMDIAAKLVFWKDRPELIDKPLFMNIGFYKNAAELNPQFWHTEYLKPEESVKNWARIYKWIRFYQPRSKIYFLPYHSSSSVTDSCRYERICGFYESFVGQIGIDGLKVIPPLNVEFSLTKGTEDWPHFVPQIYRALAGVIYLDFTSNFMNS